MRQARRASARERSEGVGSASGRLGMRSHMLIEEVGVRELTKGPWLARAAVVRTVVCSAPVDCMAQAWAEGHRPALRNVSVQVPQRLEMTARPGRVRFDACA